MNPLRKRFFGDTEVAQRYVGEAGDLLEAVHRQRGDLTVYQMHRTLGNGVELFAATRNGQDEVRILVKPKAGNPSGKARAYCVWENDEDLLTDPMIGTYIMGPHTAGHDIQFGGQIATADNVSVYKMTILSPTFSVEGNFTVSVVGPPNGGDIIMRWTLPDTKTNAYVAPYGSLFASTQTAGYAHWSDRGSGAGQYTEVDRITDYPSHSTGSYFWQGPLRSRLAYQKSSGGITYDTFSSIPSAGGVVESVISPTPLRYNGTGDAFYIARPGGVRGNLYRLGLESGQYMNVGFPAGVGSLSQWDFAVQNDGDTIWLLELKFNGSEFDRFVLYTGSFSAGVWRQVEVPDGFPNAPLAVTNMVHGSVNAPQTLPILQDPITDAICVIKADYTGAWIFNGKDCFNAPLGAFYRAFKDAPPINLSGDKNYVASVQFFNARIYVRYAQFIRDLATVHAHEYSHIGASYKVGRLLQKKQTDVES